jgi:lambda repressor-like predicted transcriptional regulator
MLPRVEDVQGWTNGSDRAARKNEMSSNLSTKVTLPEWLPDAVRLYLDHTEQGVSLRQLARREGCHASTVMRQVRRYECRRDDPLVDEALSALGRAQEKTKDSHSRKDTQNMTAPIRTESLTIDEPTMMREAMRILRRLAEADTVLAIAADLEKAAVLRSFPDGRTLRLAVTDRVVAQAFALQDWITCPKPGRVSTYLITQAGRAALKRMATQEGGAGMAEAAASFGDQHRSWDSRVVEEDGEERRVRYNAAESPVQMLARRRGPDGKPFLPPELVAAAEQLRMDFELAQMGPRVTQNWERFLTGGDRGSFGPDSKTGGSARDRVSVALRDLGPGLGDMVLRCCCFLEGLEVAEKRMGWSARSGKIVLRIALQRLRLHYDTTYGKHGPLIG